MLAKTVVIYLTASIKVSPIMPQLKLIDSEVRLRESSRGINKFAKNLHSSIKIVVGENTGCANLLKSRVNKNVQIIACPPPNPELISAGKAACWVDETIFTLESDAFPKGDLILCANSKNYISNWQYLLKRLPNHAENAIWFVKHTRAIDPLLFLINKEVFLDFLYKAREAYTEEIKNKKNGEIISFNSDTFLASYLLECGQSVFVWNSAPVRAGLSGTYGVGNSFFSEARFIQYGSQLHDTIRQLGRKKFSDSRYNQ
ncbi:unannotated protein [freshwater metagenome]|uniref:Unannotated protein n=1 Tax=freshwater metagenome TaxID=449393 RepID=A0A6J6VDN3_9ZZZZ|nr:hypothetical protein [Actinomycetota bacterium]